MRRWAEAAGEIAVPESARCVSSTARSGVLQMTSLDPLSDPGAVQREAWLAFALRIAEPVVTLAADGALQSGFKAQLHQEVGGKYTQLEAMGRTLSGMAPWLQLMSAPEQPAPEHATGEQAAGTRLAGLARRALAHGTDRADPDCWNFTEGNQPLVDAAFLSQALLGAPAALVTPLEERVRANLLAALTATRVIVPGFNNWLLFSAMVEAGIDTLGGTPDLTRVEYALRQHEQWYVGDGHYADGPRFHADYYNSFVIHPMLVRLCGHFAGRGRVAETLLPKVRQRAQRYAAVLERSISPEGTFPATGRSLAYRFGAMFALADAACRRDLPPETSPPAVRCALTAVTRHFAVPGLFNEHGFLNVGFVGRGEGIGERYIASASCYLCLHGLWPLGLPPEDPFWAGPNTPWTTRRLWAGEDVPADHALDD